MFERRLKFFLAFLSVFALVLLVRAGQVQVVEHDQWSKAAAESMKRSQLLDTVRGRILDRNGKVMAVDQPCVDVCVDYRAITEPPDPKWLLEKGEQRAKLKLGDEWANTSRAKKKELAAAEAPAVRTDINQMWADLAKMSLKSPFEIEEARRAIVTRVGMRQRIAMYAAYRRAMKQQEDRKEEAFWRRWLVEGVAGDKSAFENYKVTVAEETQTHVVLRAVDVTLQNFIGKNANLYPGLELKPSTHRTYPFGTAACHMMGRVTRVAREDLLAPDSPKEETRQYLPNDEIGRGGVEGLCELALRGTKGKVERVPGQSGETSHVDPQPGRDVRLSVDIELQSRIEQAFGKLTIYDASGSNAETAEQLHGGAVVIDIASGETLALVSAPTYDLNSLEEFYAKLVDDDLNHPMFNRATMAQLQPGSTVKPIVGLSAITAGKVGVDEGVECTGYMMKTNGKHWPSGRCWVASQFLGQIPSVSHHPIPVPHPTGFLTYPDALERSCNIYFQTMASRFGLEEMSVWYEKFGLGRSTGLGIPESRGRLPRSYLAIRTSALDQMYKTWFSGIGQDPVTATPIQMANAAATIARNGVWMRPRLVGKSEVDRLGIKLPTLRPAPRTDVDADDDGLPDVPEVWPDEQDLHLDPAGLVAAREGMQRVVYGSAGTGKKIVVHAPALQGLRICGKTGTAQAPRFTIKERDPQTGKVVLDEKGKPKMVALEPSTAEKPNPIAPWFRGGGKEGKELDHAWYIGFAPADNPKIAFAAMVEYGGSGGGAAAAVCREALTACVELGYLQKPTPGAERPAEKPPAELLRDASPAVAAGR